MGQAKQRGTFEERQTLAIERAKEQAELKAKQRRAQETVFRAAGRSGLLGSGLGNTDRARLQATMMVAAGLMAALK